MNTPQETPKKKLQVSADKIRTLDIGELNASSRDQAPPHESHPPQEIREAVRS